MIFANFPGLWHARPGLAGGIDKDGSRAAELLALGFASVEFGTVAPFAEMPGQPGVDALVARLAAYRATCGPCRPDDARIGVGLGMRGGEAQDLAADWLAGLRAAYGVADYLSFNLSARAYRPLLTEENSALLARAIAGVADERARLAAVSGRRVALALKLPLSPGPLHGVVKAAVDAASTAGFDALTAVLPEGEACVVRLACLAALAGRVHGKVALLAVGGLCTADDVRAALAAGADGVQVHSAFVEHGAACLPPLLAGFTAPSHTNCLSTVAKPMP